MKQTLIDPNPPYGEKGAFRKMTVTVPQEIYERLVTESARRKIAGEPNQLLSALLREAVTNYLDHLSGFSGDQSLIRNRKRKTHV
jgi:transcriptional regulator of met regulon